MCYNSDFSLSRINLAVMKERRSISYRGPRVIAPEKVAAVSRAITSEPSSSSSASVDRLFGSADVSTDAEEDQGQFQSE